MPPKKPSLTEDIRRGVAPAKKGPASWLSKLTPDVQQELTQVRAEFFAGQIDGTRTALARSIHAALSARGLITVTRSEVMRWINNAD